jgi:Ran-binding protein 9/10
MQRSYLNLGLPEYLQYNPDRNWPKDNLRLTPQDLPTHLSTKDGSSFLGVTGDARDVTYVSTMGFVGSVRATKPIPVRCKWFYFEVTALNKGVKGYYLNSRLTYYHRGIAIGLGRLSVPYNGLPGWEDGSWGYHGNDGKSYICGKGSTYGPTFTIGDVIGCCVNLAGQYIYWTKNGKELDAIDITLGRLPAEREGLYLFIGLSVLGDCVRVNFGTEKFVTDIMKQIEFVETVPDRVFDNE